MVDQAEALAEREPKREETSEGAGDHPASAEASSLRDLTNGQVEQSNSRTVEQSNSRPEDGPSENCGRHQPRGVQASGRLLPVGEHDAERGHRAADQSIARLVRAKRPRGAYQSRC